MRTISTYQSTRESLKKVFPGAIGGSSKQLLLMVETSEPNPSNEGRQPPKCRSSEAQAGWQREFYFDNEATLPSGALPRFLADRHGFYEDAATGAPVRTVYVDYDSDGRDATDC